MGAKAQEALRLLLDEANRFSYGEFVAHVARAVDRCTDADQGEAAQEPAEGFEKWWNTKTTDSNLWTAMERLAAKEVWTAAQKARPPVGLPLGSVCLPSTLSQQHALDALSKLGVARYEEWVRAAESWYDAFLAAAPPCPGVVALPKGWPWTPEVREYLRFLLLEARERAIRHVNADTADAAFDLARWIEAQGAEQDGEG